MASNNQYLKYIYRLLTRLDHMDKEIQMFVDIDGSLLI